MNIMYKHFSQNLDPKIAERLNLYLEKDEGEIENIDEDGIHKDAAKDKTWRKRLKPILPHVGLVILSAFYTLVGAGIFHYIIDQLWTTRLNESLDTWGRMAHDGMDAIIRDVFHDYTKYYMTPDDIITGSGHIKWSFGSSIFFAWTAITTIGGIIKIHNIYSDFMEECRSQCWKAMRKICCKFKRKSRPHIPMPTIELLQRQHKLYGNNAPGGQRQSQGAPGSGRKRRQRDNVSDAGTFDDISDIHTQNSESGEMSEDTKARAEEIEAPQPHHERRVSVIFILLIMIGYVAGGAYLIRFWEAWTYFDAFYFCFVTVTTIDKFYFILYQLDTT
ncbi:hypothetical protein WR25_03470 [Diploscapter pachys]|uniref:Potassium channel domain-containing protein n=1 Tax=Diploscapter pachys TaxID=2018661 RepID=A0A2A2LAJ9_9BILA|nr:hypothetical protein WR25_03470 [Diploscapter pachys]